jgi:hypothetical protein
MDFSKWLSEFRVLHQKAHTNALKDSELQEYLDGRNELARAILASQKMSLAPGQAPRQALRATRVLPIELDLHGRMQAHLTMDISAGGFSAIVAEPPEGKVHFSLKLPGNPEAITGDASCVQSQPQPGRARCSFKFETLGLRERERIELFVFDTLLDHLKT